MDGGPLDGYTPPRFSHWRLEQPVPESTQPPTWYVGSRIYVLLERKQCDLCFWKKPAPPIDLSFGSPCQEHKEHSLAAHEGSQ